jgi:phage protein U
MAYEKRDLTGTLFKNDKMMSESSPQYTGTVTIDGVDYWQSAWVKEGKSGVKFFSQSFKRKDAPAARREEPTKKAFVDDSEIPF